MRFTFTDDQRLFQQAARDVLSGVCTPGDVRAAWESETGRSPDRWARLAGVGIAAALIDPGFGGLGLTEPDVVLVLEEAGRVALPEPIIESGVVAVRLLQEAAPAEVAAKWLPRLAAGDSLATVGFAHQPFVVDAHTSDLLLMERDGSLYGLEPSSVDLTAQPSVDRARRLFRADWRVEDAILLSDDATEVFDLAADRAAWATSAMLLGVCETMIDLAVSHAKSREQFGRPIGAFQAVKHHLADALLALEFARPAVYRAAYAIAHGESTRATDVAVAKTLASAAATTVSRIALQVHGAIGYTWEHDLHLWSKRALALAAAHGDADHHRERVARAVVDRTTAGR